MGVFNMLNEEDPCTFEHEHGPRTGWFPGLEIKLARTPSGNDPSMAVGSTGFSRRRW